MRKIILILVSSVLALASSLQELKHTFSTTEKRFLHKKISTSSKLYKSDSYQLQKGWNLLTTPKDGINIVKTFNDISKIKYVVTYYNIGKLWAIYSPNETFSNMLFLKYLEPNVTFFVLAKKKTSITIKSNVMNKACKVFADDIQKYETLIDSGIGNKFTMSKSKIMALQSRYYSHHDRGIYNDTRVELIYPKISSDTEKIMKYGPAIPKVAIKFPKAYEGSLFYLYDFKDEKCFYGHFPSPKIPPFPVLKELKPFYKR